MQYLAALDYEHLDNGMFLTTLARSVSKQEQAQPVILHGDSAYTERIMQTGVVRNEAQIRSQKDLNHRLVALFADEGVSAVGINPYQRKLIKLAGDELKMDDQFFNRLPGQSVLILSSLVWNVESSEPIVVSLPRLARFLQTVMEIEKIFVFSLSDISFTEGNKKLAKKSWDGLSDSFKKKDLPKEFQQYNSPLYLTTAHKFQFLPETINGILIE